MPSKPPGCGSRPAGRIGRFQAQRETLSDLPFPISALLEVPSVSGIGSPRVGTLDSLTLSGSLTLKLTTMEIAAASSRGDAATSGLATEPLDHQLNRAASRFASAA
jgi:hypothetical protein